MNVYVWMPYRRVAAVSAFRHCCRSPNGSVQDVTPAASGPDGFNLRTTVYEYGGGEYTIVGDTVYFTNFRWARARPPRYDTQHISMSYD